MNRAGEGAIPRHPRPSPQVPADWLTALRTTLGAMPQTVRVVRRRLIVSGRVQGVWYRESCRQRAQALGVTGWVRNNPDGTVEAGLEGEATAVDTLIAWMRVGPPRAQVTNVVVVDEAPTGERAFVVL
jgi:acylphosphatase